MIRFCVLAIVVLSLAAGETEARNRQRVVRYQNGSYQTQSPMRYSSGVSQVSYSQNGSSPMVQQSGYSSNVVSPGGHNGSMQAWAEEEARMMASRGTCGHIRPAPPGYFVGVGCGTTCMGSGTLVAEAHYQGKMVRVWKR